MPNLTSPNSLTCAHPHIHTETHITEGTHRQKTHTHRETTHQRHTQKHRERERDTQHTTHTHTYTADTYHGYGSTLGIPTLSALILTLHFLQLPLPWHPLLLPRANLHSPTPATITWIAGFEAAAAENGEAFQELQEMSTLFSLSELLQRPRWDLSLGWYVKPLSFWSGKFVGVYEVGSGTGRALWVF